MFPALALPDENDRHVLAAAIVIRANVIVTFNEKDFPEDAIAAYRLHTKHPDDFLVDFFELAPVEFVEAVHRDFQHYGAPPLVYDDYLASLAKAGIPKPANLLKPIKFLMPSESGDP